MKLAIIGVTGMVGKVMLEVLSEEALNISQLIPVASANSVGKSIQFNDNDIEMFNVQFTWTYISRPGETRGRTHGHPCPHPAPRYTSEPPPSGNGLIYHL